MVKAINISLLFFGLLFSAVSQAATTYSLTIKDVKKQPVSGDVTLYGENDDVLERIAFTNGQFSYTSDKKVLRVQIVSSDYRHRPSYIELTKKYPTNEVSLQFRSKELIAFYERKLNDRSVKQTTEPFDTTGFITASFPGGRPALIEYIQKTLRVPAESSVYGLSEKVVIKFRVSAQGNIDDIVVVLATYPMNVDSAIEVFLSSPTWEPATKNGKPVESWFTFPLKFNIE